ncbi:hypothetical protein CWR48_02880 [Oceanobacillus arenosus]|uniref:CopG family transcriptional regulator n=1 Tax=Oceanobacillus arenosus TaxID=1229153 RepID=A0A3D8PYY3_9BACI|nr:hypothetical protein [Oceanobacillus arenosus]RDW21366.1 hypothetical protein CWR48_02880 [Oceanobacillus arenosus]
MENETVPKEMQALLKQANKKTSKRITTYLEPELYEKVMWLKSNGISVKKFVNRAVSDLLEKHGVI